MRWINRAALRKEHPPVKIQKGLDLNQHISLRTEGQVTVAEFIGTGDFAAQWHDRQRYEVYAGRDMEPLVYQPLYMSVEDASLPRNVTVFRMGPGGVVFEEILEGGEVKFATVGQESYVVPIKHYAQGLEYTKDLVIFNELWNIGIVERQAGIAFNALMNHIHLNPILAFAYAASNKTAASASGSTLIEKYASTIEDAVEHASADATYHRTGPYALLINPAQGMKARNALSRRIQDGIDIPFVGAGNIQTVIEYDGWVGTRGKKTTTYAGVTSGKAYLISLGSRDLDFQSYIKQGLDNQRGDGDVSRFIIEQVVWDTYFGMYANPVAAVEEITWPT